MIKGLKESHGIVKRFKPDLVIGTGGYVCGPVVFMAAMAGVKTMIHEQNAFPGATNRILGRFVKKIMISYTESADFFKQNRKIIYTGNPVRQEFIGLDRQACRESLGLREDQRYLLSFGGSGGADRINRLFMELINLFNGDEGIRLCHVTGKNYFEVFTRQVKDLHPTLGKNIEISPFIYDMHVHMGAADMVISRAGAISLAEIATVGVPGVLIPSPNVANNHQVFNAKAMAAHDAAIMIEEKELDPVGLALRIKDMMTAPDVLSNMHENALQLSMAEASDRIYETLLDAIG